MLFRIAWRNLWRNKLRSAVLTLSVVLGLWAGMFVMAFSWGMYKEHVNDVIETQLSHLQIHHPMFQEEALAEYTIENADLILKKLRKDTRVKAIAGRNSTDGMISSPTHACGVKIFGIKPQEEKKITGIRKSVIQGNYFDDKNSHEIIIGMKLAEKLRVKIKNKIILTFQQKSGEITSASFRIIGFYRTKNSMLDESVVYTNYQELGKLLGTGDAIHEIAILLKEVAYINTVSNDLRRYTPGIQVQSWKQLSPELQLIIDSFNQYMYVFIAIILLALMFGIINTMLMAVLERQHEFGVLMAIGMNKLKVFCMVILETILLTSIGTPLGLMLTYFTIEYFQNYGIDLSLFSEGMARFGFTDVVHPELETSIYAPISLMTAGSAILSSIYPAYKALSLKPAVAIRKF